MPFEMKQEQEEGEVDCIRFPLSLSFSHPVDHLLIVLRQTVA